MLRGFAHTRRTVLGEERPALAPGIALSVLTVAAVTGLLYVLKHLAPVVSLGVVYVIPVMVASAYRGVGLGMATALVSAAAFNFFHLPPTGRFTIADNRNWVALGAFAIVALAVSAMAGVARSRAAEADRRRREADLAAAVARVLLTEPDTASAFDGAGALVAASVGADHARIVLEPVEPAKGEQAVSLGEDGATLLLPARLPMDAESRLREQVLPSLEALVAVAVRRDELQAQAVETAALRRSDELKTAILRAVSHDLRTPLTAILTAGHALGSPSITEEERRDLSAAVVAEGETMDSLVGKLLDLSRLQAGRAEPRLASTSISEVLASAGRGLSDVRYALEEPLPTIEADPVQLERAFANVLENAVRHSAGQVVQVRARSVGSRLVVRIVDRGPGIAANQRELIFEPFYRAPGADDRHAGAGLGLAIARGFVEANHGRISVESLPGQGTSFVIDFPVGRPAGVAG